MIQLFTHRSPSPPRPSACAPFWLAVLAACSAGDEGATGVPNFNGPPPSQSPAAAGTAGTVAGLPNTANGVANPSNPAVGAGGATSETGINGQAGGVPLGNADGTSNTGNNNGNTNAGAGGSTMAGNDPQQGAAGSMMPPTPPGTDPPTNAPDCGELFLCDDFEGLAVGAQPDPSVWTLRRDYNNQWPLTNFAIDNSTAHSGQSLKLTATPNGPVGVIAAGPGDAFYLRVWMLLDNPQANAPVYIGMGTGEGAEIRMRSKTGALVINAAQGDGLAPDPANCQTCTAPPSGWFCTEMFVDRIAENATLWINGIEAGSVVNNQGWHSGGTWPTSFAQVRIGPMGLEGGSSTMWIDDVAIGSERIGCN